MKKFYLTLVIAFLCSYSFAQTNIFPSSGNVGIGTTNPITKLQVGQVTTPPTTNLATHLLLQQNIAIGNTAGLYSYLSEIQQSSAGNINRLQTTLYRRIAGSAWQGNAFRIQFGVDNSFTDGSKAYIEVGASDPNTSGDGFISLGTAGADRLVITNAGNVGMGTTSPGSKLTTIGPTNAQAFNVLGSVASNNAYSLQGQRTDGSAKTAIVGDASGNIYFQTGEGALNDFSAMPATFFGKRGCNIGIGTTNPLAKLHVVGSLITGSSAANVDGADLKFLANSGVMLTGWNRSSGHGEVDFISNQANGNSGGFAFYDHNNSNVETQLMYINGNVAIGAPDPKCHKLAVNGDIIATKITVKPYGNWPDYVFKPTYTLPSLSDVKTYIDHNQHLPDMPSKQEVAKDGINLGEIVKIQTKKIEEWTLYLIQQKEER